ncbi:MAG TPA: hypothetical protein VMY59_08730, partial [Candidatus Thermoplasmatota archaeon]|nr:hypothetical protein [Candidatus Thermoplasmatota archaeon]
CMVPIGKVLFWFGFMWSGVFSVVCILSPIKYKLLKALNFYSSAKLRIKPTVPITTSYRIVDDV